MGRPDFSEANRRRDIFARLVANDIATGGLEAARKNVVGHAKAAKLDPWRALRLSYDPSFVTEVERLAGR